MKTNSSFSAPGAPGAMTLAMRAVSAHVGPKVLRVALILNGSIQEERIFNSSTDITVGSHENNTFVLAGREAPASHVLFRRIAGQWSLVLHPSITGRAVSSGSSVPLNGPDGETVALDDSFRGQLSCGNVRILFQFVVPPPREIPSQLPSVIRSRVGAHLDGRYNACLAFFVTVAFTSLAYVEYSYDPPVDDEVLEGRIVSLITPTPEEPIVVQVAQQTPTQAPVRTPTATPAQPTQTPAVASLDPVPTRAETNSRPISHTNPSSTRESARERAEREANETLAEVAGLSGAETASSRLLHSSLEDHGPGLGIGITGREEMTDMASALTEVAGTDPNGPEGLVVVHGNDPSQTNPSATQTFSTSHAPLQPSTGPEARVVTTTPALVIRHPHIAPEDTEIDSDPGSLDPSYVNRIINAHLTAVRTCYERVLRVNSTASGLLGVHFSVCESQGAGRVRNVTTHGLDAAGMCVANVFRGLTFRSPGAGMCVDLSRNFNMDPAD